MDASNLKCAALLAVLIAGSQAIAMPVVETTGLGRESFAIQSSPPAHVDVVPIGLGTLHVTNPMARALATQIEADNIPAVPEPSTTALSLAGLTLMGSINLWRARRRFTAGPPAGRG